jgi:ATP-dependent helicase/DNAse subunit B
LHLKGSFDFQVLSPARLFTRIFDSAGRPEQTRIDERGRVTLLCALMGDLELKRYKNAQKKQAEYSGCGK